MTGTCTGTCIELDDVVAGYGELMILNHLSFAARRARITLLIGPNGAGKSTALRAVFGMVRLRSGRIRLDGADITGAAPRELLTRRGMAFVPQGRNLFGRLSVYENLELGGVTLGIQAARARIPDLLERFPAMKDRLRRAAGSLSGGEQKQLEICRALLLRPKVLLIDEPSVGLSPRAVHDVFCILRELADAGTTVLIVEQNVVRALEIAHEVVALDSGRSVLHCTADELLAAPDLERLFLGAARAAEPA